MYAYKWITLQLRVHSEFFPRSFQQFQAKHIKKFLEKFYYHR